MAKRTKNQRMRALEPQEPEMIPTGDFILSQDLLGRLLQYLASRPLGEVYELFNEVRSIPQHMVEVPRTTLAPTPVPPELAPPVEDEEESADEETSPEE